MIPYIVLDTSVLFAGIHSRTGAAFAVLENINEGKVGIHLSVPLELEYESILKREQHRLQVTEEEIDGAIDNLCQIGVHHQIHYL